MSIRYENRRPVATLNGLVHLRLKIRRGEDADCARHRRPYRPEGEGAVALPQHALGLDVIALLGALRYREHQSGPEIHRALLARGVAVGERTVTNLLDRYDELVATVVDEPRRAALLAQRRVVLALDGLQPDVGHEVVWVIRDCLSGRVLLARSLLPALAALGVPVAGILSDGQPSIRLAVQQVLPDAPHQLCHFHYRREAALPIFEAGSPGGRGIERAMDGREDAGARVVRGYGAALRSALADDGVPGRAPLGPGWDDGRPPWRPRG